MPKILRIINRFNLGGPTYNVAYLSKYLAPEYETLLIGGMNSEHEACSDYILKKLGIHSLKLPEMVREIGVNDMTSYYKIKEIIRRYKPDIVHTHASKAGFLGRKAANSLNVPVVVHTFHGHIFHSYFNPAITEVFKQLERNLAKQTDAIIAISEIQKQELSHKYNIASENKFHVIPLGFDLDRFQENILEKRKNFRNQYLISDDEIAISTIGRLVPIKNHNLFIQSIKKLKEMTDKKIKAVIIGDGELKSSLIQLANSLNLCCSLPDMPNPKADIIFTSWIHEADIALAGSDITVLCSFNEGTPVSLIEAQAANIPIVSTDVGGVRDIVVENVTALLSKNNDIDDFTNQLFQLINNDTLRHEMSLHGWDFVKNKFHYRILVENTKKLYDTLLAKNNCKKRNYY